MSEWQPSASQTMHLPAIVSSSDLFDGELFGDELIDMYNGSIEDAHNGDLPLLAPPGAYVSNSDDDHTEDILAAIDEGFSGFHPSSYLNSFLTEANNDATISLEQNKPEAATQIATTMPISSPDFVTSSPLTTTTAATNGNHQIDTLPNPKKRTAENAEPSPHPKRKVASPRRMSTQRKATNGTKIGAAADVGLLGHGVPGGIISSVPNLPNPLFNGKEVNEPASPNVVFSKVGGVTHNVKLHQINPPESVPQPSVSRSPSESDFKELAQAAVSAFMTGATSDDSSSECNYPFKVDTSTAHVNALTGNNWVAACVENSAGNASVSSDVDSKTNNRCKRQNMSADERARQNRDRNREHARNTRLRKKAYVEELKHTLSELVTQRDLSEAERRQSLQRESEQREVRFRVMEEFLKLRGRNETNSSRWAAILEDSFIFTVPSVEFRNGQPSIVEKAATGVADVMKDSAKFNSLITQAKGGMDCSVSFQYVCDRKDFFMDGSCAMMEWNGFTINAVGKIKDEGLALKGMIRAQFSPASNKLLSVKLIFDASQIILGMQMVQGTIVSSPRCDSIYGLASFQAKIVDKNERHLVNLPMPCLSVSVPSSVMIVDNSSSESSSEKGDPDSDESVSDHSDPTKVEEAKLDMGIA